MYSKYCVSHLFDGTHEWKKDFSRRGVHDVTTDEVVMVVKHFDWEEIRYIYGYLMCHKIIGWGVEHGLVPADEKETHAFGINPETRDLQRQFSLMGLGSYTEDNGHKYSAVLRGDSYRRELSDFQFDAELNLNTRFLFVAA
jgi:hypothetical protein